MTASPTALLDLPNEILLEILTFATTILPHEGPSLGPQLKARYAKLCLVCKAFCSALTPLIWKDISISGYQTLESFYRSLHSNIHVVKLIYSFTFSDRPVNSFKAPKHRSLERKGPSPADGSLSDGDHDHDRLNFILSKLTNVRFLSLGYGLSVGSPDLTLLPCPNESLEAVHLYIARTTPYKLAEILRFKKLEKVRLTENFEAEVWKECRCPLAVKTQARELLLKQTNHSTIDAQSGQASGSSGRLGVSCHIFRSIVSCFDALSVLETTLRPDDFDTGELDTIFVELAQRCKLSILRLHTTAPPRQRRLEIDFSTWQLQELWIDSICLWPLRDSWQQREGFYKILPPSLKVLHMTLPWKVASEYGLEPYDGAFQLNSTVPQDWALFRGQKISVSRLNWICSLLYEYVDKFGTHTPYLPQLKTLGLRDSGWYSSDRETRGQPGWATCNLPPSIATKFVDRGIKVDISAVDWKDRAPNSSRWRTGTWTVEL